MRNLAAGSVSSEREIAQSPRGKRQRADKEQEEDEELERTSIVVSRKIRGVDDYVSIGDKIEWNVAETSKYPIRQLIEGFERSWANLVTNAGHRGMYRPLDLRGGPPVTYFLRVLEKKLLGGYTSFKKETPHTTSVPGFTPFG